MLIIKEIKQLKKKKDEMNIKIISYCSKMK